MTIIFNNCTTVKTEDIAKREINGHNVLILQFSSMGQLIRAKQKLFEHSLYMSVLPAVKEMRVIVKGKIDLRKRQFHVMEQSALPNPYYLGL